MSPADGEHAGSLGISINASTRPIHTRLNKLIVYRLPLSLPPQAEDPAVYVSGLLHVAPIYDTFESLWRDILQNPLSSEYDVADDHTCEVCMPSAAIHHQQNVLDEPHQAKICTRVQSLLNHLHTPELERTESLKQDISSLTGWSPSLLDAQLSAAAESPILSSFLDHIRESVQERPHVLLAYAWVLYMALFSGGRFIRATLAGVDPTFWTSNDPDRDSNPPVAFFTFDVADSDELKLTFKKRLVESENLLTPEERSDIVAEGTHIFEFMINVVSELDSVCGTESLQNQLQDESIMGRMSRLLGLRTRDSVAVTKERRVYSSRLERQEHTAS
ncbi:hypothetical protein BX600DRAFT_290851 [Xylariales sp. PMI_506]|nr:hypothetical protein BX600DRAFT_290851 [Xylariales sp. PMI_506]